MKSFDSGILAALTSEEASLFYLIEMQFDDNYFYTDCDIDLVWGGDLYRSKGFEVGNISTSATMGVDSVDVSIDNSDLEMSAVVLGEDISGLPVIVSLCSVLTTPGVTSGILRDTTGAPLKDTADVTLTDTTGAGTTAFQPVGIQPLFRGLVNNWDLAESRLRIGLVNELALWNKRTLRPASASCPWAFGGTECKYTGTGGPCNQSYTSCVSLGNHLNFGGFRFLPSIVETSVWWGREPK